MPQTQELQFTYIPGGSEIISIDAYNRSVTANDFVIGITIIKVAVEPCTMHSIVFFRGKILLVTCLEKRQAIFLFSDTVLLNHAGSLVHM